VPVTHAGSAVVPAVSGSSGKLVVQAPKRTGDERRWPGQVFAREEMAYSEAMDQFVAARRAVRQEREREEPSTGAADLGAAKRAVHEEIERLRRGRRQEREQRRLIDAAWTARQREHQQRLSALGPPAGPPSTAPQRRRARERRVLQGLKRAEWVVRHEELARRRQVDARWREERQALHQRALAAGLKPAHAWLAILVIMDNCTRRCLDLPLFVLGAHVTADQVVAALRAVLPQGLRYLIADGGTHFTAEVTQELARGWGFVRVPLATHRPQSNGIAERFIQTLKAWLTTRAWQTAAELEGLLATFRAEYHERPHQGRELAGLSPNEYTARLLGA
jgi:hypothetical protein